MSSEFNYATTEIDDIEYNTEDLSDRGQAILKSLQFVEVQIQTLMKDISVYNTAQQSYISTLKAEIKASGIPDIKSETSSEE